MNKVTKQQYPEILFLFPGLQNGDFGEFVLMPHLGVGYILAYLKQKGINSSMFIHKGPVSLNELVNKILKQQSKIIGFTCYDTNYYYIKLISGILKKKNRALRIIVGGPTATFSDELIMQDNPAIDICVRGEGEYTVYELIKRLRKSPDISDINGITYRLNGKLLRSPDRPLINGGKPNEELDILPSPYQSRIISPSDYPGILSARGCVFKCTFCNYSAISRWTIRYHSIQRVISELKIIEQAFHQASAGKLRPAVEIFDDAFSLDIARAKQICHRIIDEKIRLYLRAKTRADRVDRELLELMRQAGFEQIRFGLDSASPKVLYYARKVRTNYNEKNDYIPEKRFIEKVKENVALAKSIGLNPAVCIMVGLPGATLADDKATLEFVRQLNVRMYSQFFLQIYSGTELFNTHRRYGLGLRDSFHLFPRQTEYTYDISNLAPLRHEKTIINNQYNPLKMENLINIITGEFTAGQGDVCLCALIKNYPINNNMLEWISRSIAISPGICFIGNYSEQEYLLGNAKKMLSANLPFTDYYLLTTPNKKATNTSDLVFESNRYKSSFAITMLMQRNKRFSELGTIEFIPFANYSYNGASLFKLKNNRDRKIFLTLFTVNDIERFLELVPQSERLVLAGGIMNTECHILDECRWSDQECPALKLARYIIEDNGAIKTCFSGKPVGRVGDDRRDIIRKLRSQWEYMKKERGCDSCVVRDSCSKCLFTYPMDNNEYCQIRRSKYSHIAKINRFFRLLKVIKKIRTYSDDAYSGERYSSRLRVDRVTARFDNELTLVDTGRKEYLYHHLSDRLYGNDKKKETKSLTR